MSVPRSRRVRRSVVLLFAFVLSHSLVLGEQTSSTGARPISGPHPYEAAPSDGFSRPRGQPRRRPRPENGDPTETRSAAVATGSVEARTSIEASSTEVIGAPTTISPHTETPLWDLTSDYSVQDGRYPARESCPIGMVIHGTFCRRDPGPKEDYYLTCRPRRLARYNSWRVDYHAPIMQVWGKCPMPYVCARHDPPTDTDPSPARRRGYWTPSSKVPPPGIRCIAHDSRGHEVEYQPPRSGSSAAGNAAAQQLPLVGFSTTTPPGSTTDIELAPLPESFSGVLWVTTHAITPSTLTDLGGKSNSGNFGDML